MEEEAGPSSSIESKELQTKDTQAPGHTEQLKSEEPSPLTAGDRQGAPSPWTQGSLKAVVMACRQPNGDVAPFTDQDVPQILKTWGHQKKRKTFSNKVEQAASLPDAIREQQQTQEYTSQASGNIEKLNSEEPKPLTAAEGQGEPSTQGSLKAAIMGCEDSPGETGPLTDLDMPQMLKSRGKKKNFLAKGVLAAFTLDTIREEEETEESSSKGCEDSSGETGLLTDHDMPQMLKSRGLRGKKKNFLAKGVLAASTLDTIREEEETEESSSKVPGHIEMVKSEEPSTVTAGEGQGAPSTLGSLKAVDMSCGHPFGDPGPLTDHDMPQIPKSQGHHCKNKNSFTKVEQDASPPDAVSEEHVTLDSGSKALGHIERPKSEEPSPITAAEGQGEPYTQGSLKADVIGCGYPSLEPGPLTDHNMPQILTSQRCRAKKKTFLAKEELAASPPPAISEDQETWDFGSKAPGNIERPKSEEPSPLTAGEGQGAPSTLGSLKAVDMSCGHPFGDPGPLTDHDMPQIPKSQGHHCKNKNSFTKVEQDASPPDAVSEEHVTLDSGSKALGHIERPKSEEPSPITAAEGQGEPYTQGSLKADVIGCGYPSLEPGPLTDHNMPQILTSQRCRAKKKTFLAKEELAASPPPAISEDQETWDFGSKAPGNIERPKSEEPSPLTAGEGQGAPSTQGLLTAAVFGCGHPSPETRTLTNHNMPQMSKSQGLCAKKTFSTKVEQAASPPNALREERDTQDSGSKAPGHIERSKSEEPSTITAGEQQGEPSPQGSLQATVMGCGHPSQEPGPSVDHDMPQTSKSLGCHGKKETIFANVEQAASPPDAISEKHVTLDSGSKAPGHIERPKSEEPSPITAAEGQGEPYTQGSLKADVMGHPSQGPGPSTNHNMLQRSKSRRHRARKKTFPARVVQAASSPHTLREEQKTQESGLKAPGHIEKLKSEEPSPFIAGEGQGEPSTQGSLKPSVMVFTPPSVELGASIDHGIPHTSKALEHGGIQKPLMAQEEPAAAPH